MIQSQTIPKRRTTVEDVLIAWCNLEFRKLSMGRDLEEREWQEEGLFYQRRQWLEWRDAEQRFHQIEPSKTKPRPMPVSNYFAKTVNANANQLGAQLVRVIATPKTDDQKNRRAAEYAETAKEAIDQESDLRLLNPLLAKQTALWGLGCLHDEIDTTSNPQAIEENEITSSNMVGCIDCGEVSDGGEFGEGDEDFTQQQIPCPSCGSPNTMSWKRDEASSVSSYVSGKGMIKTSVVPVFEIYLPRNVQNANLAKKIIYRPRKTLSELRRVYGEKGEQVKADDAAVWKSETRIDVLRSLSTYSVAEKMGNETATITEVWTEWDELPIRLQDAIEDDEKGDETLDVEQEDAMEPQQSERLMQMKANGLFIIYAQDVMLEWGPNPFVDPDTKEPFFPFTFFLWDVDPASVYPKGAGADLVPLQKRLNRLDSLIELAMMTNGVAKWLWPNTQNGRRPPSGDPTETVEYDVIGDGKVAPQLVGGNPFSSQVWQLRAAILQDFQQLGLTLGVMSGNASSDAAFRTVAYLGAKASEQLNTQRYLWESAHCLHYKKTLSMAKTVWDEERQVKIAGPNGKAMFEAFSGEDLRGLYQIDFVPDSSVPKTTAEKIEMLQQLIMGQLVDMMDSQNRQYMYDIINMEGLNLAGELQYRKAERDLEAVKRGEMPPESPFQDWQVSLKVAANFTLTEEFESLDPQMQSYVLAYAEYMNEKVSAVVQGQMMQGVVQNAANAMTKAVAPTGSSGADPNNQALAKVPGTDAGPQVAEKAAASQGADFAADMGA